ncbi:hypothetical protein M9Y10_016597 [Tritrichomonas musculus]|uniref:Peptidase M14 domain-containing protein n=1 Tax=Tritrichomonas musculus TaxID=1915356 RepID=A0ABR2HWM0_9EUKA
MLSSDSGSDDEQYTFVPHESIKDVLTIIHKGKPPKEPQPFAMGSNKKVRWPVDLWDSGTLIYSIENPNINLKPPVVRTDKTLRFNSRFESGNLSLAYQLSPDTYHLILEYDKNKSGSCQWFYFQMKNVRKDIKYTFYISGFHKGTTVDHGGLKVFWYSEKRAKERGISWSRGGYNYEYGITLRDSSRKRASLQFKISFPYDNDTVYLCYALPYTYSDLQRNIIKWQKNHFSIFSSTILCQTLGGRDCPLITITSPRNIAENNNNYLFFTARVHPGESNGSYVLHGLIDFLLSDHPAAKYLVSKYIIKIVPMLNIDGVVEGFYRIGLSCVDLNRVWQDPNPTLHPVITATKNLIKQLSTNGKIAVYIDFHGHSRLNGCFAYGCPNNIAPHKDEVFLNCSESLINTEKLLPRIISFLSDAFSWGSCQFSYPKERKAASRIVIRKEFGIVQSFTVESSFGGIISGPRAGVLYDEIIWKELGSKCGEGVYHLLTKNSSPLASYVEREIMLITPNRHINFNSEVDVYDYSDDCDNNDSNENKNDEERRNENENEMNNYSIESDSSNSKPNSTFNYLTNINYHINNNNEDHSDFKIMDNSNKTNRKTKKKGTTKNIKKKKGNTNNETKTQNKSISNTDANIKNNNSNTNDIYNINSTIAFTDISNNLTSNSKPKAKVTKNDVIKKKKETNDSISNINIFPNSDIPTKQTTTTKKKNIVPPVDSNETDLLQPTIGKTKNHNQNQHKPISHNQTTGILSDHLQDDEEESSNDDIEYVNQRRLGKFGPKTLFRMTKPKNSLFANSKIISSQSPGYSAPKWVNIQFSKR